MFFRRKLPFYLPLFIFLVSPLFGGKSLRINSEKVYVNGGVSFSELYGLSNVIEIFPEKEGVLSLGDILKYIGIIDISDKSGDGIYGDIRMRGSTFSQVLICIDGVPLYNYQTAHLNLTLPINLNLVKKIEVIPGPVGTLFGGNIIGGVINIITNGQVNDKNSFSLFRGSNSYYFADTLLSLKRESNTFLASFQYKNRGEFIPDRDYRVRSFNGFYTYMGENFLFRSKILLNKLDVGEKNFFANFSSYENIRNYDIISSLQFGKSNLDFGFFKSRDEFLLKRYEPDFYRNLSNGKNYFFKYSLTGILCEKLFYRFSLNFEKHLIDSIKLNSHSFSNVGVAIFFSYDVFKNFKLNLSERFDYFTKFENKFLSGLSFSYKFSNNKISLSYMEGYRIPSFIELYYNSPSNHGNENLKPEDSRGVDFSFVRNSDFNLRLSIFYRRDRNLIDWVSGENFWDAKNISSVNVLGEEIGIGKTFSNFSLNFFYTHIDEDFSDFGHTLKYGREFLKNKFTLRFRIKPCKNTSILGEMFFSHKSYGNKFFPVKITFSRKFGKNVKFFIKIDNLLNEGYESFKNVRSEGRSFKVGIKFY